MKTSQCSRCEMVTGKLHTIYDYQKRNEVLACTGCMDEIHKQNLHIEEWWEKEALTNADTTEPRSETVSVPESAGIQ